MNNNSENSIKKLLNRCEVKLKFETISTKLPIIFKNKPQNNAVWLCHMIK
jgi:hypothetical protein